MAKLHIAVLLALSSALCVAIGDVLQQHAAHRISDRSVGEIKLIAQLIRDPRWWWGAVTLLASIGLQAAALGEGSVLLVQPLLMLSLLFALPINAWLLHRAVSAREWIWAGLLTAAVILIVTVGNPRAGHSTASPRTWAAVAGILVPVLVACVVAGRMWGGVRAAVLFALVSGSMWGIFAVLTKDVVHRLGDGAWAVARTPELYAVILVVIGGFAFGQSAFRAGPLTASMPTLQVSQPVLAAVLGVVVLGETLQTGRAGMVALAVAAPVMIVAIWALARVDAVATRDRVDEELDDALSQPV